MRWLAALDPQISQAIDGYSHSGRARPLEEAGAATPLVAHVASSVGAGLLRHYEVERSKSFTPVEVPGNATISSFAFAPRISDGAPLSVTVREGGAELNAGYWFYYVISTVGSPDTIQAEIDHCRVFVRMVDSVTGVQFSEGLSGRYAIADVGDQRFKTYTRRDRRVDGCPVLRERAKRHLRPKRWAPWDETGKQALHN